jgi:hypothetical protein
METLIMTETTPTPMELLASYETTLSTLKEKIDDPSKRAFFEKEEFLQKTHATVAQNIEKLKEEIAKAIA